MTVPVRYYCPHCGAIATLERDAYLADKSVTPYPLDGWEYAAPADGFEDADGVRLVCGEHTADDGDRVEDDGCGEPFYLNFVRYEDGEPVERRPESEYVELNEGTVPTGPRRPGGPTGPN